MAKKLMSHKEELEAAKKLPPEKRRSLPYHDEYPKSTEKDWGWKEGAGWVHDECAYSFVERYRQCFYTKIWFSRDTQPYITDGGHNICPEEVKKGKWELCDHTERLVKEENLVEAWNKEGDPIKVSKEVAKRHFYKCDYSGKLAPSNYMLIVMRSNEDDNGKQIPDQLLKKVFMRCVNEDHGLRKCRQCGHVHPLKWCQNELDGRLYCDYCYPAIKSKDMIKPYNHHIYPGYIPTVYSKFRVDKVTGKFDLCEFEHPLMYGVELEIEFSLAMCQKRGIDRFDIAGQMYDALGKDFIVIKEDGSLLINGHYANSPERSPKQTGIKYAGFEAVTCPASFLVHRKLWDNIHKMKDFDVMRAWDTETCAMHVHVSRAALSGLQIGRIVLFVNSKKNRKFIQKVAGRSARKYAYYGDFKITDVIHTQNIKNPNGEGSDRDQARRVAINLYSKETIEFRIFRGTVNPKHIMRNLEFVDACVHFCYPGNRSLKDMLSYQAFVKFVGENRKRWPLLVEWLMKWDYLPSIEIPEFVNPHAVTAHASRVVEGESKLDGEYTPTNDEVPVMPAAPRKPKREQAVPKFEIRELAAAFEPLEKVEVEGNGGQKIQIPRVAPQPMQEIAIDCDDDE